LPDPWPRPALDALLGLLAAGPAAVPVFEALDRAGLLVALLPEWAAVRSRPQRNSWHRHTVDRHLVETAAGAAGLTRRVGRPDLLLLAALLHDVGKGAPGDHSAVGAGIAGCVGSRLGLVAEDVDVLVALVRHHLLLADGATRRDLDDPATAEAVARTVGSAPVLELLAALTEADSRATGPAAWTAWRAALVGRLVDRVGRLLAGVTPPPAPVLRADQEVLVRAGVFALQARDDEVTVVAPDRPGLLAAAAGVLALHRLDVLSAWVGSRGGSAVAVLRIAPRFGGLPDWDVVRDALRRALDAGHGGGEALEAALRRREQAYARHAARTAPPRVRLVDDATPTATVVEVHAPDGLGVLHRICAALLACELDVRSAHISTLGADVVDAFYVVGHDGQPLRDPARRRRVVAEVLARLAVDPRGSAAGPPEPD
nr:HD domain-containing protein [Actinomycetota bacterium]